ncbi:hypothetical protein [Microvirga massiliensis]|uniref:hypothetical protein n=1 Tax=Microvirga massiliensis TaxID=1033741 RepID=UPI0011C8D286|nr:hypothetical protein [Microvirga massiliensis]
MGGLMHPADKGTRDLLPFIQDDPGEIVTAETVPDGSPALANAVSIPVKPSVAGLTADPGLVENDGHSGSASVPIKAPAFASTLSQTPDPVIGDSEHIEVSAPSLTLNLKIPKPPAVAHRGGSGNSDHQYDEDGQDGHDGGNGHGGEDSGAASKPSEATEYTPGDAGAASEEDDHTHSIGVTQVAEVDQDASIIVQGYVGEVCARLHIDQDVTMDQDVDISFAIDGDGHFDVLLDQDTRISQDVDIDIRILDVDDVLHVDVFLRDSVEVEQDTTLGLSITDGPPGGNVAISQDIELDQNVDIDIDIEDELEEHYGITVAVNILQEADTDQDAVVDIVDHDGEIDMDIEAIQTAFVDQETLVRIDFALA